MASKKEKIPEEVRLQKFLASGGICSRRAAETLIGEGAVRVNGRIAEPGQKIVPGKDKVTLRGKPVAPRRLPPLTLLMNKPRGCLCSNSDPHHDRTVFDLLPPELAARRLFCAGRLDKDSEGLLILTDDGDLAHHVLHPSKQVEKQYQVRLRDPFPRDALPQLLRGVRVEGELLRAEKAFLLGPEKKPERSDRLEVHLHHGRKREVRRLFEALGHRVKRLRRTRIGPLSLKGLGPGKVRPMTAAERKALLDPSRKPAERPRNPRPSARARG